MGKYSDYSTSNRIIVSTNSTNITKRKRHVLSKFEKELVVNVYNFLKLENPLTRKSDIYKKLSEITNFSTTN